MMNVVILEISEYEDLIKKQNEPTKLVEDTAENYKQNLIVATQYIDLLEKELKTYRVASVPKKPEIVVPKKGKAKKWTKDEDVLIYDTKSKGASFKALVKQLGRTTDSVRSRIRKLKLYVVNDQISQYQPKG